MSDGAHVVGKASVLLSVLLNFLLNFLPMLMLMLAGAGVGGLPTSVAPEGR